MKLLKELDTSDYWFKTLLNDFIAFLELTEEYSIVDMDDEKVGERNSIVVSPRFISPIKVKGTGYGSDYIYEMQAFNLNFYGRSKEVVGNDKSWGNNELFAKTIFDTMNGNNFASYNIYDISFESSAQTIGIDKNGRKINNLTINFLFYKKKEEKEIR